jgi:signal peptidase II
MQKGKNLFTDKRSLIILLTVFVVVIADLLTKEWVRSYPLSEVIQRIGFIQIIHIQNTGAAFGFFQGHSLILALLAVVEIAALLTLAYYVYKHYPYLVTKWNQIALGLILAGAVGNLIDRMRFGGAVTDFIDAGFWPAFNVADSGVTIGAVMLAITVLRLAMKGKN